MGNYTRVIGIGAILAALVAIAWQFRPLPEMNGLFAQAKAPEGWVEGPGGPLGQRVVRDDNIRFVRVADVDELVEFFDRTPPFDFRFELFDDARYRISVESIKPVKQSGGATANSIRGNVDAESYGRANLVLTERLARGTVHVDDRVYELLPVSLDITAIMEIAQEEFSREARPFAVRKTPLLSKQLAVTSIGVTDSTLPRPMGLTALPEIGVLVIRATVPGLACAPLSGSTSSNFAADAEFIQNRLDDALSPIAKTRVTLDCMPLNSTWQTLEEARRFIRDDPGVQQKRHNANADLVVMLVKHSYYCGWSMFPDYPDYPIVDTDIPAGDPLYDPGKWNTWADFYALNAAFSVVGDGCEVTNYSMAHEIGHLLGMKHERFSLFGGKATECGYGYPVMHWWRPVELTAMSYRGYCSYRNVSEKACPRVPLYSRPGEGEPESVSWIRAFFRQAASKIEGRPCTAETIDALDGAASNIERLKQTARIVATYSDRL